MSIYNDGTIAVTSGSKIVVGTGTAWSIFNLNAGIISIGGLAFPIKSVEDDTHLTIDLNYPGIDASGLSYSIARETSEASRAVWSWDKLGDILRDMSLAGIHPDDAGTLAQRDALDPVPGNDFIFLRIEVGYDLEFYKKVPAGWEGPFAVRGASGAAGAAGNVGRAGLRFKLSTTTAMSDPGTGFFRFNHATIASATALALDDLSSVAGNPDVSSYFNLWGIGTSTLKGYLTIFKVGDTSAFIIASVSAVTDNPGWSQFTITPFLISGTHSNNDEYTIEFIWIGFNGDSAGLPYNFDSNTAMADPGTADLRLNHGTLSSVTAAAISDLIAASGNPSAEAALLEFGNSTNTVKGSLRIVKVSAPQNFAEYNVTGVTNNSGWVQLALTHVSSAGSFSNADSIALLFSRAGDKGNDGADGVDGADPGILFNWDDGTSDADPGAGNIRGSNVNLASASFLYADDLNRAGTDISAFLLTLAGSTNTSKGVLILTNTVTEAQATFEVISVTDASGYVKIGVTDHAGATSFPDGAPISFQFSPAGDKGADGAGAGDVSGPASSVDLEIPVFSGTGGKTLARSQNLLLESASFLAIRNATTAQGMGVYNTWASATSYERIVLEWVSNVAHIGTQKGSGGGSARNFAIKTDDVVRTTWSSTAMSMQTGLVLQWGNRGTLAATADGIFSWLDNAGTSFGRLRLGGTTNSFPAIKRNGAAIDFRLADDSANTAIAASQITLDADPTTAMQAATKQYVDAIAVNLGKRARVRAATTANITIATALNNGDSLDGVTLATGDLVLVKNQSSAQENGVYVVGVSPARSSEFDTYNEHPGSLIGVAEGSTNADTIWICTSNDGGTLNTTAIAFTKLVISGELLGANNLSDVANAATAFGNIKQAATTSATGVVELLTNAEFWAASDTGRVPTASNFASVAAKAHKNGTNQNAIAANTATHITFGTEVYDTNGWFASSRFTPLAPGRYLCIAHARCSADSSGDAFQAIITGRFNGAEIPSGQASLRSGGVNVNDLQGVAIVDFDGVDDYFEWWYFATVISTINGGTTLTGCEFIRLGS